MTPYLAIWGVLLLIGMPIAFSLGVVAFGFFWIEGGPMQSLPQRMFAALDSFPLLAVPAFILAGEIMNSGGVSKRIFDFARMIVGHVPGGLGHVNVATSVISSGMSGSALADAAGIGAVVTKAMKAEGFDARFAGSLTAASCIIGPLIPPSIPMVIYAVMAGASVGKLFLAGFAPGILTAVALSIYVYVVSRKRNYPRHPRASLSELWVAFRKAAFALLAPVIILGGIFGGLFTPTEAAGVAAFYALLLGLVIYRDIRLGDLPRIFRNAAATTAVIGLIVACANLVSYVLTRERVPQALAESMLELSQNPIVILLIINVLLLILGCFLEGMAVMLLTVPILLPLTNALGIDPVHFGVVVVMNLMIGILTPPMGMALFVVARAGEIPIGELMRGIWPFILVLLGVLLVVTLFPGLVLALPNLFFT